MLDLNQLMTVIVEVTKTLLYLINAIFLICLEWIGTIRTVGEFVFLDPLIAFLAALGLKFCNFDISPKVYLKKLISVVTFS